MDTRINEPANESRIPAADRIVDELKTMIQRAEEKAVERAKAADRVIRDHPYQTIGIAFGLGLLIGVLARRKPPHRPASRANLVSVGKDAFAQILCLTHQDVDDAQRLLQPVLGRGFLERERFSSIAQEDGTATLPYRFGSHVVVYATIGEDSRLNIRCSTQRPRRRGRERAR